MDPDIIRQANSASAYRPYSAEQAMSTAKQVSISERLQDAQKLAITAQNNLDAMSVRIIGPTPSLMTENEAGKMIGQPSMDSVVKDLTATLGEILATVNRLTNRI